MSDVQRTIEIMAPAGSFEALRAAIKAGAGSVYFGVGKLNMRAHSANFVLKDLPEIAKICKEHNIKSYLTVNTVVYENEIDDMKALVDAAKEHNLTAIIASDISVISYAHSVGVEVHISTQANISNSAAVKFYAQYADVVVLAREVNLLQIKKIYETIQKEQIKGPSGKLVEIEIFVHGALCVAVSGKCYMSLATYNSSANRGACLQNCRRSYKVIDEETGDQLKIDNNFVMSPSDLCTIGQVDKMIAAGVSIMKIEGRGKGPEYVYETTKAYKEAVEAVHNNTYSQELIDTLRKRLENVFNRGFWEGGHYLGKKTNEWAGVYGSKTKQVKRHVGTVMNYYGKPSVAHIYINENTLTIGDEVIITGPTTGFIKMKLETMYINEEPAGTDMGSLNHAKKGDHVTFVVPEKVRKNDQVFIMVETKAKQ
ncbi:MAG: peptidase U32 family protein [Candidatus Woesearchaeota archaeon]